MTTPIPFRRREPVLEYDGVIIHLRAAARALAALMVSGDTISPSQWYQRLDDLYECLLRADTAYAEEAKKIRPEKSGASSDG